MRRADGRIEDFRAFLWWVSLRSCQRGGSWEEEKKIPPVPPGYGGMKDGEMKGCVVWLEEDYVRTVAAEEEP